MTAETKTLSALRPRRNLQPRVSVQRRHTQLATERRLPWRQLHVMNQVIAFNRKIRMARQADAQEKVPAFTAARSRLALASEPDPLSLVHAFRNFDLITFDLVGIPASQRDGPLRSVERFLKRDHDVRFDVISSFGAPRTLPKLAPAKTSLTSPAEKRLEEIAEASPAEFEVDPAAVARGITAKPATRLRVPSRWRLESARLVPVRSQLVVFLPLLRIAQDLVGFVDLFEFFFRRLLIFRDVRMMLARQLSERLLNLVGARRFRNAERLIIISELDCHFALQRLFAQGRFATTQACAIFDWMRDLGRMLAILGGVIMVVGVALWSGFGATWLGRLPGDIRIERGNAAFYFPIVTCIIVSIVVTLLLSLFRR